MSVDADTVRRIAHLARMAVAEDEVEPLRGELNAILAFVEQLSEVNVDGVEPMTSVTPMEMKKRPDVVTDGDEEASRRAHRRRRRRRGAAQRAGPRRQLFCCPEGGGMTRLLVIPPSPGERSETRGSRAIMLQDVNSRNG